ncbi:hypothetical protein HN292_18975, partial [Acinetobacter baumannii]|nr:hypothetical protein [Acinetobacter baumannii]
PQISPLEGRLNIRYVADKYNLGLLWRAVAEQNRVSLHQGNIVAHIMSLHSHTWVMVVTH